MTPVFLPTAIATLISTMDMRSGRIIDWRHVMQSNLPATFLVLAMLSLSVFLREGFVAVFTATPPNR